MKKSVLLCFALCATLGHLSAQISGIGFRPALTLSKYKLSKDYNDIYDAGLRPGAGLAAFLELNLGNRFTLQPEISFTQRGVTLVNESTVFWDGPDFGYPAGDKVTEFRQKETLNYIDVPLMVEKNFGGGRLGAYIAAGPALSFAIGGRGKEEIVVESPASDGAYNRNTDQYDYNIEMGSGRNDTYKGFDMSLNAGGGLLFILESGEIGLDLRYTHGLRQLSTEGFKNRNFTVGISYMHYLGQ